MFDITASNQLWQTDMTAIWCGEDGWGNFTAVIDCYDRVLLGWSFTLRCRAVDVSPSLEMAWSAAFPYGRDDDTPKVTCRHDNGTQFTSTHYRGVAKALDLTLSRTAYRHAGGNASIERMFRTLKEEAVWPDEFDSFDQARTAVEEWITDYNTERPHASPGERTPAEARAEAAGHKPQPDRQPRWGPLRPRQPRGHLTGGSGTGRGLGFRGPGSTPRLGAAASDDSVNAILRRRVRLAAFAELTDDAPHSDSSAGHTPGASR